MHISVRNKCDDFNSYRAARVKSLFNCGSGANFNADFDIPDESDNWKIGVVVGPSGTGKTSVGRKAFGGGTVYKLTNRVDGGGIIAQRHCFVRPDDTPRSLWRRDLAPMGVEMIAAAVEKITRDDFVESRPQDERLATWEPSIGRPPVYRPDLLLISHDASRIRARGGKDGTQAG